MHKTTSLLCTYFTNINELSENSEKTIDFVRNACYNVYVIKRGEHLRKERKMKNDKI